MSSRAVRTIIPRPRAAAFRREWRRRKDPGATPAGRDGKPAGEAAAPKAKPDRQKRRTYLREYVHRLWPYRWSLLAVYVLAPLSAALDLVRAAVA